MADQSNADSRHHLTIAHPEQITKDMQGPDNPIPLSPQWLLPKPQENKLGIGTGEAHFRPHANRPDSVKALGNGDDFLDTERKKDVFRPSFMDTETGRRDRWRDEEREINSAIRKDRWREGEKEPGDSRRTERRMDNSSKHSAEARWVSSERWNESGNRDREGSYDQRRDSKWNTRWGPDDREPEGRREKWSDSGRDGDGSRDKGILHSAAHGKNMDREGDHNSRTWRSNSQNRGRGESPYHQNLTPNKQGPMFGHGRGRGENSTTVFSMGRGKATHSGNSANNSSYPLGALLDKSDGAHGDSRLRYSRMKLLDIYRLTDVSNFRKPLEGFVQVSSLTQEEPLEPLALSAPTSDESVILKGIDKGDVVNSGAPQISKDGSIGRNSNDVVHLRQTKLGSRDDLWSAADDNKEESTGNLKEGSVHYKVDEMVPKEASMWRSQSVDEQRSLHDWKDLPPEVRSRSSVIGWSHSQKDQEIDKKTETVFPSSYYNDEVNWQNEGSLRSDRRTDSDITRRSSEILDQEREALSNFQPQSSPEDLSYYYKDPQGKVQGPFSGSDLIGWFEAGYFGIDLQVRVASAPPDRPFSQLGDAMPHLRMKARPPPGFNNPKQNEALEVTGRAQIGDVGAIYAGLGEVDLMKNDQRSRHVNATETENRFLESLMSGQISSPPLEKLYMSEGLQGYSGIGGGGLPSMGAESGNDLNYLLAQKMSLERQRSLSNPLQYWPGNDAASMVSKTKLLPNNPLQSLPNNPSQLLPHNTSQLLPNNLSQLLPSNPSQLLPSNPTQHSKLMPPVADSSHLIPQPQQHVDLLSILQAAMDKPPASVVNNGATGWSNIPDVRPNNTVHGSVDILQDKADIHQNSHFASQAGFGIQHQTMQMQNPTPSHIITQTADHPSNMVPSEKFLSGIPQDVQSLKILQQQYLLSQLQSQSLSPAQSQPSLFDKLRWLEQQQQERQQLMLQQQRQQLLSQVLSEHQSQQHFVQPSFGNPQTAMPAGILDHLGIRQSFEQFQLNPQTSIPHNPQTSIPHIQDGQMPNFSTLLSQVPREASGSRSSSLQLPHQIFENASQPKNWGATPLQQVESIQSTESLSISASEVTGKPLQEVPLELKKHTVDSESAAAVVQEGAYLDKKTDVLVVPTPLENFTSPKEDTVVSLDRSGKIDSTISGQVEMDGSFGSILEESQMQRGEMNVDSPAVKVKNVEGREAKKASEKKSRKQKNSKAQSVIDGGKGILNAGKQDIEIEGRDAGGLKFETPVKTYETPHGTSHLGTGVSHSSAPAQVSHQVQPHLSRSTSPSKVETGADKAEVREIESASLLNAQTPSGHRAWKPAPGLKPKSLLEIQQEEQQRAQTVMVVPEVATPNVSRSSGTTAWVGVVANSELKSNKDVHQEASGLQLVSSNSESITSSKSKKSQLYDLLAEEVLSKSNESILDVPSVSDKGGLLSSQPPAVTQVDPVSVGEDDFVEAKDTKKNRKKAAKVKAAAGKTATPVASTEISSSPVLIERGKSSRQMQQENDNLPAAPSGPSLADFVFWKGEQPSSVPAPAWSTDSAKLNKQTSLRDILKEQERRAPSAPLQVSIPTSTKPQATRITRTSSSSWQLHGSSPSKVASPVQISSAASTQSKNKTEDDLFWGPLDQSKQDTKQSEYPSLSNHSSRGTKAPTVKGSPGATTIRQKPSGSKPIDYSFSSSPSASLSSSKGKRDATTKYAEAMDFREWCESESIRLTGASDMSFLEFCSKQSTSEAEMLLKENLGPLDPDHTFIDKFLNYKELLSADVIEIAFQARGERRATGDVVGRPNTDYAVTARESQADAALEASAKGGGKKKGKKAKKVPASVLGFNVVSNRIMMGEIQTIED